MNGESDYKSAERDSSYKKGTPRSLLCLLFVTDIEN